MLLDNIVIGSTVESALYAFLNDYFFIPSDDLLPPFFKKMKINFLGSPREDYTWSRLNTLMAFSGKLLNYENVLKFRISESKIKIITENSNYNYEFGSCYIFDPTKIIFSFEIDIIEKRKDKYIIYDDFQISSLGSKYKFLEPKITEDNFASKIHYYSSDRVDGSDYVTDCLVESFLEKENLLDFNYSETMCRFVVERHLSSIGVLGSRAGSYKNGKTKFRKPKVIHNNRVVLRKDETTYRDTEKIKFIKDCKIEDLLI